MGIQDVARVSNVAFTCLGKSYLPQTVQGREPMILAGYGGNTNHRCHYLATVSHADERLTESPHPILYVPPCPACLNHRGLFNANWVRLMLHLAIRSCDGLNAYRKFGAPTASRRRWVGSRVHACSNARPQFWTRIYHATAQGHSAVLGAQPLASA